MPAPTMPRAQDRELDVPEAAPAGGAQVLRGLQQAVVEAGRDDQHEQQRKRQRPHHVAHENRPEPEPEIEEGADGDEERRPHGEPRHEEGNEGDQESRRRGLRIRGMARPTAVATIMQTMPTTTPHCHALVERLAPLVEGEEELVVVLHGERVGDARERPVAERHHREPDQRNVHQQDDDQPEPLGDRGPEPPGRDAPPEERAAVADLVVDGRRPSCAVPGRSSPHRLSVWKTSPMEPRRRVARISSVSNSASTMMTKTESAAAVGYFRFRIAASTDGPSRLTKPPPQHLGLHPGRHERHHGEDGAGDDARAARAAG